MHPGVVVLGGESLEAALDQAAVVGGEVHLVEEVAAVARVDEDRPGPAGDLQVAPDPLGGGPGAGLLFVGGRDVAGQGFAGGLAEPRGVDVYQ